MKKEATTPKWEIVKKCTGKGFASKGCGAEFPVKVNDVRIAYSLEKLTDSTFFCRCPVCNNCTEIPNEEVPLEVKQQLFSIE